MRLARCSATRGALRLYLLRKTLEYVPRGQQGMVVDLVRAISPRFTDDCQKAAAARVLTGAGGLTRMAPLTNLLDYVPSSGNFTRGDERGSARFAPVGERAGLWSRDGPGSRHDRRIDLPSTFGFGGYAVANNACPCAELGKPIGIIIRARCSSAHAISSRTASAADVALLD
jgi:hypothetical protein